MAIAAAHGAKRFAVNARRAAIVPRGNPNIYWPYYLCQSSSYSSIIIVYLAGIGTCRDQCLTNAAAQACAKRKRLAPRRAGERNARSTAGPTSRRALNSISGSRQRSADATRPHLSLGEALRPPPLAIPLVAIQSEYISVPPRHTPRPESPGSFA